MPSYQLLQNYPSRQYQFMQDTLNGALQAQMQMSNPQQVGQMQPNIQNAQNQGAWNGQQ